jgi:hypothetical protein
LLSVSVPAGVVVLFFCILALSFHSTLPKPTVLHQKFAAQPLADGPALRYQSLKLL